MEVDDIQNQVCKFPRISTSNKIGQKMDDEDESEAKRMGVSRNDYGRLCGWPSSRIVRVSRASGGKDRHSKVWTSKGLRDRRVRLSVTTAIQFYDLQDRLGYDQPSKAVDWLLRAAETSISELPSLNHSFLDTPLSDEIGSGETGIESTELEMEVDPSYNQQQQNVSLSKSACSSTSETSKGSGGILSVSRSENRIKARERARGRAAEKVKNENEQSLFAGHQQNVSTSSSFTELLTGNLSSTNSPKVSSQWHSTPMDHFLTGYSGQIHMGNSLAPFSITTGDHNHNQELHQFSFVPDNNLVPVATAAGGNDNYNLNFSVSSGLAAGYNRGTLQSNSPSMRFAPIDGSNVPFFISPKGENHQHHHHHHQQQHHHQQHHHQFAAGSDLQLFYGDANWNSDQKGKGKN